ncbi:exonuclease V, chloroplastic-like isoform X2 [Malania oleifera]|uniref:exonuclease V, chloroplastic-like isoform X2 n=1 Tax=Malania oleifera TaxID=397392 RepID=UPI0025ADEE35|nr:exonuclease V, chloroplastic-like isoform X2 [Malania oleifera]
MADSHSKIPIEIVSEEEMALLDAALSAATASLPSSPPPSTPPAASLLFSPPSSSPPFHGSTKAARSVESIARLCKRRLVMGCEEADIEDSGRFFSAQKRARADTNESLLRRFRKKNGLAVSDIAATLGRSEKTRAMKAGSARHMKLEEEVVKKVKICVESVEDDWAVMFVNFMVGANQLLVEGLTRELPLIGFVEGVWMVGMIDEIRMPPLTETDRNPTLVETKTREKATLPAEAQWRNGRFQLMCYKLLWDNIVAVEFPSKQFFNFFDLNPHYILSEEIRRSAAKSGFTAETLDDLVRCFREKCCTLPAAHNHLLLRYEFQDNNSLLCEDKFGYEPDWLKSQLKFCLEFWSGERAAMCAPEEERWKCRYCQFASICPTNTKRDNTTLS